MSAIKLMLAAMVAALLATTPAKAEEPSDTAMAFAGLFSDVQLSGMLSRVGAATPTMLALGQAGGRLTQTVFDAEIDKAVEKYGDQWQRNMALAWAGLLTDEELASLMTDASESPYRDQYLGLRPEAGERMKASSGDLFREILQEVIDNTAKQLVTEEGTDKQ